MYKTPWSNYLLFGTDEDNIFIIRIRSKNVAFILKHYIHNSMQVFLDPKADEYLGKI